MNAHVHIGALELVQFSLMLIIVGFLFRTLSAKLSDSPIGQALAYIY